MVKINLRKLLTDKRMNQSELAALTGIRPSTICDICNNTCSFLKIDNMIRYAEFSAVIFRSLFRFFHSRKVDITVYFHIIIYAGTVM